MGKGVRGEGAGGEACVSPMQQLDVADGLEEKLEVWNTGVLA